MTTAEALKNIEKACETIVANWQVHMLLQQSLDKLRELVALKGNE